MGIVQGIKEEISSIVEWEGKPVKGVVVEISRDLDRCDIVTNAAMVLAKFAKCSPKKVASLLMPKIKAINKVQDVEVAGPGFINIVLDKLVWTEVILDVNSCGAAYGNSNIGAGRSVNIEFVSANPTGPMHVGHARGAIIFDVLANLFAKIGYRVTREYYTNDSGVQIDNLVDTAVFRYKEALGKGYGEMSENMYPGLYMKMVAESLIKDFGESLLGYNPKDHYKIVREYSLNAMMSLIKKDLELLKVKHNVFVSESEVASDARVSECIDTLSNQGLVYNAVLPMPKGKSGEDWIEREQMLFRTKHYGDDTDRPLTKSNNSWTYFAKDVAYHWDKVNRNFDHLVIGLGSDHSGYVKRLKAVVNAISGGKTEIDVQLYNIVNFFDDGVSIKMSKRSGTFLSVQDIIQEVGADVVRFTMLTRKQDVILDFDFQRVKEQSKDNPVFYVQYACARIHSVLNSTSVQFNESADLSLINHPSELKLLKLISKWPEIVRSAATACEPSRIVFYLIELAEYFHSLWSVGKSNHSIKFIVADNEQLTAARLAMVQSVAYVIASGLELLNIEPVNEM